MTHLYNCKSVSPIEYRITKFDSDYEVMSSYVVSNGGCDCPQGNKPTCRHRKMLPAFAKEGHIDDGFFYEWDTRQWRKPLHNLATEASQMLAQSDPHNEKIVEAIEAIAKSLESESSPKAAAIGNASALPPDPPAAVVEHRAAPTSNPLAGGSTFKRRSIGR